MNLRLLGKTPLNYQSKGPNGRPRATHVTHPRLRALPRAASTRAGLYLGKSATEIAIDSIIRSEIKLDEKWTGEKPRDAHSEKSSYAGQLAAAKTTATPELLQTINQGGTYAAGKAYFDWLQTTITDNQRVNAFGHPTLNPDDACLIFEQTCIDVLAAAVKNHPTVLSAETPVQQRAEALRLMDTETRFAYRMIRSVMSVYEKVAKQTTNSYDLALFSNTSRLMGIFSFYCDLDDTLVQNHTQIRPAVPLVFDFLKKLLTQYSFKMGIMTSRGNAVVREQLRDPHVENSLYPLNQLVTEHDVAYVNSRSNYVTVPYLLYYTRHNQSPYDPTLVMGWTKEKAKAFLEGDPKNHDVMPGYEKLVRALCEIKALSNRIQEAIYEADLDTDLEDLLFDIEDAIEEEGLTQAQAIERIKNSDVYARFVTAWNSDLEDNVEYNPIEAESAVANFQLGLLQTMGQERERLTNKKEADVLYDILMKKLPGTIRLLSGLLKQNGKLGLFSKVIKDMIPELDAWFEENAETWALAQEILKRYSGIEGQLMKELRELDDVLLKLVYVDTDGQTKPIFGSEKDGGLDTNKTHLFQRWLYGLRICADDSISIVIDNGGLGIQRVYDILITDQQAYFGTPGEPLPADAQPVDPFELFGIHPDLRKKVYPIIV